MKIAYIRTHFTGGSKIGGDLAHTIGVLDGFKRLGCEVKVFSNERFFGIDKYEHEICKNSLDLPVGAEFAYNFYAKKWLKSGIERYKPDYIYHRQSGGSFLVAKISGELKIPFIAEFNFFISWEYENWHLSSNFLRRAVERIFIPFMDKIEKHNLKRASVITAVAKPLYDDLLRSGISGDKIIINPNGVDTDKFNPGISSTQACRDIKNGLGIPGDACVVCYSGTFRVWHGIPWLTEAIRKITDQGKNSNIHFVLLGDGPFKEECVEELNKYSEVTFTGAVPYNEMPYYLGISDIFVSPHGPHAGDKTFHGSPTKLFEYMALGKGIVASDLGQIGEILEDRRTALLVEPGDAEALAGSILELAGNKSLRDELGRQARIAAEEKYTWDKHVGKILSKAADLKKVSGG